MKLLIAASLLTMAMFNIPAKKESNIETQVIDSAATPKIQAAILLDVSGSMSGLIDQAKVQLWNMVSVLGKAKCDGKAAQLEIALYEYGRPGNGEKTGFIKQISPFTTDLDSLSQQLFELTTDGGDEYCGQVIYTAIKDLAWDKSPGSYKVIFIAGNEDFLQGNIKYTKSCSEAAGKGVIVNTIFCGDKMEGIREHWNLQSECGNGSYSNIDHNAVIEDIETPYDSLLMTYNTQLNGTYVAYGYAGKAGADKQLKADAMNYQFNKSAAVKRVEVKAKKEVYKNNSWDAVDASESDKDFIKKLDKKTLPTELRDKSDDELAKIIEDKKLERRKVQDSITLLSEKRNRFIALNKAKATQQASPNLQTEIEKIIRQQAKKYKMTFE